MTAKFVIEPFDRKHDRKSFDCGVAALNRYIVEQAGQDIRRRAAACYVAREEAESAVAGYYTLSAGDVPLASLPDDMAARLPRYPVVPVARIGRLAIDLTYQGKRLGSALLWDAASRALRSEMAVFALAVEAKDDPAAAFYVHLGFTAFKDMPKLLVLPLATLGKL